MLSANLPDLKSPELTRSFISATLVDGDDSYVNIQGNVTIFAGGDGKKLSMLTSVAYLYDVVGKCKAIYQVTVGTPTSLIPGLASKSLAFTTNGPSGLPHSLYTFLQSFNKFYNSQHRRQRSMEECRSAQIKPSQKTNRIDDVGKSPRR